jgi:hypothetical protein
MFEFLEIRMHDRNVCLETNSIFQSSVHDRSFLM